MRKLKINMRSLQLLTKLFQVCELHMLYKTSGEIKLSLEINEKMNAVTNKCTKDMIYQRKQIYDGESTSN